MNISIIAAVAKNNAIGKNNDLLVYISSDLKRFKQLTTGHSIIMGRKTFESLPNGPLPNRKNIVLSNQKNYSPNGCTVVNNIDDAIAECDNDDTFIIGGASIYNLFMNKANKLYITEINHAFPQADVFFPQINETDWQLVEFSEILNDEKSNIKFSYKNYTRRNS